MSTQILRRPAVSAKVGLCRSALYAAIKANQFPRPIRLGPRAVGWIESEIDAWIIARSKDRDVDDPQDRHDVAHPTFVSEAAIGGAEESGCDYPTRKGIASAARKETAGRGRKGGYSQ